MLLELVEEGLEVEHRVGRALKGRLALALADHP